jgi:GT2 family glycosyltransferase
LSTVERATVVIPNWNGKRFLGECLGALAAQSTGRPRIIVVDNGSTDGSVEFIKENYPFAGLIGRASNEGFSRAVNRGIRESSTEFIALLNNDAVPDPGWLAASIAALDEHQDAGSCASKIVFHENPDVIDSVGDLYTPWGMVFNRGHGEPDDGRFDQPADIFGPCAAAAVYRKSLFDDIGLFDENIFAYYEDTDLNLRAILAGHKPIYAPGARVRHHYSGSSTGKTSKLGKEEVYLHLTGVLLKNMPAPVVAKHFISIVFVHSGIIFFHAIARLRRKNRLPRVPFFKFLGAMLAQRAALRKKRNITADELNRYFHYRSFLKYLIESV